VTAGRRSPAAEGTARGTLRQRSVARGLATFSWVTCRTPERLALSLADLAGAIWYRADRRRADQARRNLARVVGWLAAEGSTDRRVRAAASDPAALERLVRSAFRYYARYYLDVARAPSFSPAFLDARLEVETPDSYEAAFGVPGPRIFIGIHYGAIELQAYVAAARTVTPLTTPMETIDDPELQGYFVRTRGALGIHIVGLREARREVSAALARGEYVGLVADRDLTGGGMPATLFGAPTSLPLGPALVALESGAPAFFVAVRRRRDGRYLGRLERLEVPAEGTRRERVTAFLEAEARAFEREIARAPDQWWAVFFPIWPDLEGADGPRAVEPDAASAPEEAVR